LYATPSYGEHLEDDQVQGYLYPQETTSPDGSTVTYVWSHPALAHLNMTFVRVVSNSFSPPVYGSFYFPGYEPHVAVTTPGTKTGQVDTDASLQIHATVVGVSQNDQNGSGISSYHATGLPPGLEIDPTTGKITGASTRSGTFTPTISVTAGYNTQANSDGSWSATQSAMSSTTFQWRVRPLPTPKHCSNSRVGTGHFSLPATRQTAAGVSCPTLHQRLRHSRPWRWGAIAFGGLNRSGVPTRFNPRGWTCTELTEYFSTRNRLYQVDGTLVGSVTECDSNTDNDWFRVTMGRTTRWRHKLS
jgi:Putative Ig domain